MDIVLVAPHSPQAVGYDTQSEFISFAEYHHQYCRVLSKRGHNVEFWHLGPRTTTTTHEYGHKIRQFHAFKTPIIETEISPQMYKHLVRSEADIFHFHSFHSIENWPSYLLMNIYNRDVVGQNHGPKLNENKISAQILYDILDFVFPDNSIILSVNKKELENLSDFIDGSNYKYLPNGIDTEKYYPKDQNASRQDLGLEEDQDYVLYVGRISPSKGVEYLIKAVEQVPATLLLVYGGGDEELIDHLQSIAPPNVRFIGSVDDDTLINYYTAADVCAFPSINEGFGVVCLEAMACQTAIIGTYAHQQGGQNHLIDGENSLVVSRESSEELRENILTLLSDDDLRDKIAKQGREHVVQNFSWDVVGDRLEESYHNLLSTDEQL